MPRPVSTDPRQARKRMRRISRELSKNVALVYEKPIAEWDFEELCACRPKGPDGKFRKGSPPPEWLTDVVRGEIYKRLQVVTRDRMASHTSSAIETLLEIMRDDSEDENGRPITPSSVRLDAAKYLLDHLIGKATAKVELNAKFDLNNFLAGIMVNPDGVDAHPVIEAAVEEEEPEDDDE
jgi:hypothetical protein